MKKLLLAALISVAFSGNAQSQSAIVRGEASPGVYETIQSVSQALKVTGTVTSTPSGTQTVTGTVTLGAGSAAVGTVTANPGTSSLATYSATTGSTGIAASATDVCTITGSATKTIRVTKVRAAGAQTTAGQVFVYLIKRSTANTGGTSGAVTAVPYDSASAAATATVLAYTANPTTGTTVGTIQSRYTFFPALLSAAAVDIFDTPNIEGNKTGIVLRGITQVLAVNFGGSSVTGGGVGCTFEWTEE